MFVLFDLTIFGSIGYEIYIIKYNNQNLFKVKPDFMNVLT